MTWNAFYNCPIDISEFAKECAVLNIQYGISVIPSLKLTWVWVCVSPMG